MEKQKVKASDADQQIEMALAEEDGEVRRNAFLTLTQSYLTVVGLAAEAQACQQTDRDRLVVTEEDRLDDDPLGLPLRESSFQDAQDWRHPTASPIL